VAFCVDETDLTRLASLAPRGHDGFVHHITPRSADVRPLLLGLGGGVVVAFMVSLLLGPTGFALPQGGSARWLILTEIRLPRAVFGVLVGAAIGIAGAALQGFLRNPLAEPGVLGVSGGAALGAVLAIHTGLAGAFALALPLAGLAGAAAATLAVLLLAGERSGSVTLLLAGVAISSLAAALTSLALNLSSNPFATAEVIFWMMGSLADRSTTQLWLAGPLIVAGVALLLRLGPAFDALSLGEDVAMTLGRDLGRDRLHLLVGVALSIGAATAVTGMIGFVGLIVPHVLRRHVGHQPSALLLASALGGALLLLLADSAVRLMGPLADIRIGVLTALIGAPFFLWLVWRQRAELTP
jgi:iron complex transport system permease protein